MIWFLSEAAAVIHFIIQMDYAFSFTFEFKTHVKYQKLTSMSLIVSSVFSASFKFSVKSTLKLQKKNIIHNISSSSSRVRDEIHLQNLIPELPSTSNK